jgi:hypothetical protein
MTTVLILALIVAVCMCSGNVSGTVKPGGGEERKPSLSAGDETAGTSEPGKKSGEGGANIGRMRVGLEESAIKLVNQLSEKKSSLQKMKKHSSNRLFAEFSTCRGMLRTMSLRPQFCNSASSSSLILVFLVEILRRFWVKTSQESLNL